MPRKSFEAGMEAGAKPFEEKFKKQADAIEKVGARIDSRLDEISSVMDVMIDDLSAQERKRVYDLNTVVDISDLDKTEKEYLCAIVYAIAALNSALSKEQKEYLRALKAYLMISNVQGDVNLASIENIDNITTQKAILQTIMEFLFLEYGNHDYMDDYEDVFDYFSVNRKGIREIQDGIDSMYDAVGMEGIASHYSFLAGTTNQEDIPDAKEESMLDKAERAYLEYNITEAYSLFMYLAEQGIGRAMYFLGEIYAWGYSGVVGADKQTAAMWREKGAKQGDALSYLNYAYSIEDQNKKKAIFNEVFEKVLMLAQQGDIFAMYEIADMYANGYGTSKDDDKKWYWLNEAASRGFWKCLYTIASNHLSNDNYSEALTYYRQAAEFGYEEAIDGLAYLYLKGLGVETDKKKAVALYEEAALKGCANSCHWLTILYYWNPSSNGFTRDVQVAKRWYELGAKNSRSPAQLHYQFAYFINKNLDMYGIDSDAKALKELMIASSMGYERAEIEMAFWFCNDKGVTLEMKSEIGQMEYKDHATFAGQMFEVFTAKDWREEELKDRYSKVLKQYADKGNAEAQYYYGMLYTSNSLLGKNYDVAKMWVRKAAAQGVSAAKEAEQELSKFLKTFLFIRYFV